MSTTASEAGTETRRTWLPRAHPVSWWMLGITTLAILITSIDRVILPTLLPDISNDFGLSATAGGVLVSLSFAGTVVGAIVLGVVGDVVGRGYRRAYTWVATVAVTCVASIATAFTRTLSGLAIWRVIMGVGTGSMEPVNVAMVAEWWPRERRGFATGVHHTGFPIGQFLGPALIGAILVGGTWRDAFLWIPLLAVPIMLAQLFVGTRPNLDRVNRWIDEHRLTPTVRTEEVRHRESPFAALRTAARERNVWWGSLMAFGLLWAEAGVTAFLTTQLVRQAGNNSPFPVVYALIIDSAPTAASSGMGLVIGIAFGLSGVFGPTVSGWMIDTVGFTSNYLLMAGICLVMVIPVWLIRETVRARS